jgi:hypothetical protein
MDIRNFSSSYQVPAARTKKTSNSDNSAKNNVPFDTHVTINSFNFNANHFFLKLKEKID